MLHHRLKEAQAAAEEDDDNRAGQKTAKAIEAIIRAEHRKEAYEKIRFTTRQVPCGGGLDKPDVPKRRDPAQVESNGVPEGWGVEDREILLDVEEIHSTLLERN